MLVLWRRQSGENCYCYHPEEWFNRLMRLGKYDNGVWMEFDEEELDEIEADEKHPLSDGEREIVARIRAAMAAKGSDILYLGYW